HTTLFRSHDVPVVQGALVRHATRGHVLAELDQPQAVGRRYQQRRATDHDGSAVERHDAGEEEKARLCLRRRLAFEDVELPSRDDVPQPEAPAPLYPGDDVEAVGPGARSLEEAARERVESGGLPFQAGEREPP